MNIVHLNDQDMGGGAANAAYRLHQALLQQGVCSTGLVNKKKTLDPLFCELPKLRKKSLNYIIPKTISICINRLCLAGNNRPLSTAIIPRHLEFTEILSADDSFLHLHWLGNNTLSIEDIASLTCPMIWTMHDMWPFLGAEHYTSSERYIDGYKKNNRDDSRLGFDLNRYVWNRKAKAWKPYLHFVGPSQWITESARESFLLANHRIHHIPNPIDTQVFKIKSSQEARISLSLPADKYIVLFGADKINGNLRKGFDLLLDALQRLKSLHNKILLVVFGDSSGMNSSSFGLPTIFAGMIEEEETLVNYYNAADCFVIPSRQDNFPNTAVEAQACGLPVVGFAVGGIPEIISHCETGYLAKPYKTHDLANGIQYLMNLTTLQRLTMSTLARKKALQLWSYDIVAPQYMAAYDEALESYQRWLKNP